MPRTEGTLDRAMRILFGLVLIALSLTGQIGVWGGVGVVPLVTGTLGAELEAQMAQSLVDTAVMLARQVVRSELQQRPDCVQQVAREAVEAVMLSARHLRLRLNPADQALVAEGAADILQGREVQLLADPAVQPGGCVVDSDLGRVDAQIETRWAQAAAVFNVPLPWAADEAAAGAAPAGEAE